MIDPLTTNIVIYRDLLTLDMITEYFNESPELQELVNYDHHSIILTNDTSQISQSIKNLFAKGHSFVPTQLIMIELTFNLTLIHSRYMFSGKSSPPRNHSSVPCPPKKSVYLEGTKNKLFINIKRKYIQDKLIKDEQRSLTTCRRGILFNPQSNLLLRSQDKGSRFVIVDKQTAIVKANHQIERSRLNYDSTKEFNLNVDHWAEKQVLKKEISVQ